MKKNKKNKFKKIGILNKILFLINIILYFIIAFAIIKYKFFNFKKINFIVISTLLILNIFTLLLSFKRHFKILNLVLSLMIFLTSAAGVYYIKITTDLFSKFNYNAAYKQKELQIITLKDSNINSVKELENIIIYCSEGDDQKDIDKLKEEVSKQYGIDLRIISTNNYSKNYKHLLDGNVKAIVFDSAYKDLYLNIDSKIFDKVKVLFSVKINKEINFSQDLENSKIFNIYISGIDSYGPISGVSRSDVNIIASVNLETKKILLVNTPRDTYVKIPGEGNDEYDKLTHAGMYGVTTSLETLENLYNINIPYYVRLNFTSFLKIIDLLDGIDVENDQEFTSYVGNYYYPKGILHLDSKKALSFVRERKSFITGDYERGRNHEKVITAIIKKINNISVISKIQNIALELSDSIQTNMQLEEIMNMINENFNSSKKFEIKSVSLTVNEKEGLTSYMFPGYNLFMAEVDENSLQEIKDQIRINSENLPEQN